ncbi:NAD(P)/FAD-dependent oxidoreductase [Sphingomonas koreensis]|uniref:Pyridine nucleotide-disulfide oxidoreductase domain-containing protein 2 n=1 Tax=Sphingomonas koreensis TaxID=93064 RepID=A0A1L6J7T0_9SPHN|nr:NAD(P)/FAD-dependent oxidoreductase [Sphingomonas koreensis]APR51965.1 FAD-dependent oxidoreductase [Sphingomonas koreensis]MDC7812409.1 NAD(P)/FAD-dependent oxidoreductase [Sphingomonas koreensis]RSU22767.1 NAD(P)/FAD-dependent oxidoreductase [Sphingomonas koreensis]RSU30758.1 NAD(P)/FAD-dependent oxidoreductase [Sphingomonas koreensis]RSU31853.1 NAD(P)/FAD-dependent oxidoreductase [Sphingomonas koreensis]
MTARYDALIIGGGHNGLTCAFYLARAGLKVRVLERRDVVGGAAVTEEFHPGFRNSAASYTVSLLQPKVIADMKLAERGYRVIERPVSNFFPLEDGHLILGGGAARTQGEFARFSMKDAAALPGYSDALERVAEMLRSMALKTPPNAGGGIAALLAAAAQGRELAKMPIAGQRDALALFVQSAREFLDQWFENEHIKAAFAFDAVVGNFAGPSAPGSAYVLLHHVFGEVNGKKGAWGHPIGGMGAITGYMADAAREAGVEISLEAPVERVLVEPAKDGGGKVAGVRLASGEEIVARTVVANVGPALLYRQMIDPSDLDEDFRRRIAGFKTGSGSFRMNVALSELPDFTVLPGKDGEHHRSGIIIAPTMDYMDRAHADAVTYGWSNAPVVEMTIPSTVDDSLAPPGAHVASLFCQHFAPVLPNGRSWDDEREAAADDIIDTITEHAPNFRDSIIARQIHSPTDLERKFGLVDGDIFHGRMSLDQLWAARPVLGHGDYRGPIAGLYMCGAGTHPGGGVTGAPGHNAAREILRDRSVIGRWLRR